MRVLRPAVVVALALSSAASGALELRLPAAPGCPVFPADNPWNQPVDRLPVAAGSAGVIASIGADEGLHPDFGSGLYDGAPIGIPITVVSGRKTPK